MSVNFDTSGGKVDSVRGPLCVESSFMDYERNQIEEYELITDLLSVLEIK